MLFKEFLIWVFWGQMMGLGQVGSKMAKKVVFIPATLLPTQFFLKAKFVTVITS